MNGIGRLLILAALTFAAGAAQAAEPFALTSPAFKDGGWIARKYAGDLKGNANCLGSNVSPALSWRNVPAGTRSLALMLVDLEGRGGLGVNHFVAYGIDPAAGGFAEGQLTAPSPAYVGGKSTQGLATYMGPCPTPGSTGHHYNFVLVATDLEPGALPPGLTREELLAKLDGHAKGAAAVVGLFKHP